MKCHQYGISARVRQKSFRGENSGGFANFRLVSQVNFYSTFSILINRIRSDNDRFRHTFRSESFRIRSENEYAPQFSFGKFLFKSTPIILTEPRDRTGLRFFLQRRSTCWEWKKKFQVNDLKNANVKTSHVNLKLSCREHKTKFLSTKSSTNCLDCQDSFLFLDKKKNVKKNARGNVNFPSLTSFRWDH